MDKVGPAFRVLTVLFQQVSLILMSLCAFCFFVWTVLASFGALPWLEIPIFFSGSPVEHAGMLTQTAITILLISVCFLAPTNYRVMKLEQAHHTFSIRMEDVARAYRFAHADDRKGLFHCRSEFDSVKERINHLNAHPDLTDLEPDIMEIAAQMSHVSQELAQTYSDERVERACDFLRQRQDEISRFEDRIDHAKAIHADIRQWANKIELDEAVARSQLARLIEDLNSVLPEIAGDELNRLRQDDVIPMHKRADSRKSVSRKQ